MSQFMHPSPTSAKSADARLLRRVDRSQDIFSFSAFASPFTASISVCAAEQDQRERQADGRPPSLVDDYALFRWYNQADSKDLMT
jgi:hypothetical protein